MSSIVEQIENEIASFQAGAVKSNTGKIVAIADGVAKLEGLSGAMYNEMIDFGQGVFGIALNLEEDEVGCVILGDYSKLKEATKPPRLVNCFQFLSAWGCSVVSSTRLVTQSMARAQLTPLRHIRSTKSRLALSRVSRWISRCRLVSCRLTR